MYVRHLRIKLKMDRDREFGRVIEQEILPLLRTQKGFQGEVTLVCPKRDEAIAITFWDNQEDADAYNHVVYLDVLRALSTVIDCVPILKGFEVLNSTAHETMEVVLLSRLD